MMQCTILMKSAETALIPKTQRTYTILTVPQMNINTMSSRQTKTNK